jgi:hypothetical protein
MQSIKLMRQKSSNVSRTHKARFFFSRFIFLDCKPEQRGVTGDNARRIARGVPTRSSPTSLFSPGRICVETSGDNRVQFYQRLPNAVYWAFRASATIVFSFLPFSGPSRRVTVNLIFYLLDRFLVIYPVTDFPSMRIAQISGRDGWGVPFCDF